MTPKKKKMPFSSTYCPFFAWYFFAFHSFFLYSLFHRLCSSAHSCDCDKCGDNRFCSWLGATASFFCSGCYTINLALCMRAEWLFRIFEQRICLSGGLFFASPSFSFFFCLLSLFSWFGDLEAGSISKKCLLPTLCK